MHISTRGCSTSRYSWFCLVIITGQSSRIRLHTASLFTLQNIEYSYDDAYGNLTRRHNLVSDVIETFTHDVHNRLTSASRIFASSLAPEVVNFSFNHQGNIELKSDYAGAYQYGNHQRTTGNAGPHAVTQVTLNDATTVDDFSYDDNGNMLTGFGRSVWYNYFNKPLRIEYEAILVNTSRLFQKLIKGL